MEDQLILVDLEDREIGYMSKSETHRAGRLHRAFSVFVIYDGKILIQKRKADKYHSGGLWANTCCSHPRKGEKLEEAVHRRMREEVGFDCDVEEWFHFVYRTQYDRELFEFEYDHVFVGEYQGTVQIDENEIEEIRWADIEELKKDVTEHPERYASWFLIAFPGVLDRLNRHR